MYVRFTRSVTPHLCVYSMENLVIPQQSVVKLLGVTFSSDLKWNIHTNDVCNRASRMLGFISKSLFGVKAKMTRVLYISLVRSVLLFGTPAWNPTTIGNINLLERVQKRATRLILGVKRYDLCDDYECRLVQCKLPSVQDLLISIDLSFLKNCLSGKYDFGVLGPDRITVQSRREGLRGGSYVFSTPRSFSNCYSLSYFPRVVANFNSLPNDVKACLYKP